MAEIVPVDDPSDERVWEYTNLAAVPECGRLRRRSRAPRPDVRRSPLPAIDPGVDGPGAADALRPDGLAGLLVLVEGVNDHENLGALFRNAAAFGAGAVLLDPTCADPLYRRSIRVSMGQVLRMRFARMDWPASIGALQALGYEVLALTPSPGAEDIDVVGRGPKQALLVGAEGGGLSKRALAAADRRVRIPMAPGVDSLNVATAAAIALHHLARPG
ncbi:MAG: RNA methyltransferase [Actinobacteria bacterium]|nr:RNA methyltransferase [Actinomycetota bacterium]